MADKIALTDRKLKSLGPSNKRYEIMDSVVPGFGVRVAPSGKRTFILISRFGGSKNPTRRALGEYGVLSLEQAREKAREWIALKDKGVDPTIQQERSRRAEIAKQRTSFESVAEEFLKRHVKGQRTAKDSEREIRKELIGRWGKRPITEITRSDVISLIEEIADRPAPYYAHLILGHLRSLFNWAIARDTYGLVGSPCDRLKPAKLIGEKKPRKRVLSDAEIEALWRVTEAIGYPFGPLYRTLLLTGARKNEVAAARWNEFDFDKMLWVIPPERFKSNETHLVPLTKDLVSILESLPRFNDDFLFSAKLGKSPVSSFTQPKHLIDAGMESVLGKAPPEWVTHDIRRTVRTRLASLRVADVVAEMVIGHGRKGIQRVYDQHSYEQEMREALELWAARLRDIVTPPPDNVVRLKKETA